MCASDVAGGRATCPRSEALPPPWAALATELQGNPGSRRAAMSRLGKGTASQSPPAVPSVLFTSPGMVCALFLSLTEHPKSPSLMSPEEVRKMLAPNKQKGARRARGHAEGVSSSQGGPGSQEQESQTK